MAPYLATSLGLTDRASGVISLSLDPPAANGGCPTLAPSRRPVTFRLRATKTEVGHARRYLTQTLAGLVPAGHLDDLHVCASELATNALRAALDYAVLCGWNWRYDDTPIRLSVTATEHWSRLDVHDPDPVIPNPGTRGLLAESGKGLLIVRSVAAACWWDTEPDGKVVHAVIPMPKVELTAAELEAARR